MPNDPQSRVSSEGVQPVRPERPSELIPEEVAEPGRKRNAVEAEWLSMATADPAHFLKDLGSE